MKMFENKGEATVKYYSSDFQVVRPGSYVLCAVSGAHIPLDTLTYWDADKQEAYASYVEAAKAAGLVLHSDETK